MKIATVGTGPIVEAFLSALDEIDGPMCVAMYSRKETTAKPLADQYNIPTIYTDFDHMLADPNVEVVYVASPNSLHYQHALQALEHRKHVICEKPFTSTARELEHLISVARKNELMLFEAITTIHLPNYQLIKENIHKLGSIKMIQCNYSQYSSRYDRFLSGETPNVFNPAFSGGALMDINVYNIHFVMNLLGPPEAAHYIANQHANGIDTSGVLVLKYPHFISECVGCKDTQSMNFVLIQGEKGYIHVENGANGCRNVKIYLDDQTSELNAQTNDNLLYYETRTFYEMYQAKNFEKCYELLTYSHSVMRVMEHARREAGIEFPADSRER
ncbi:Gfo/Idh/MocA family protein [Halalkalibacterium halodurans]|jgi:predicted dehydrogenase|uniref:Gfo/Idh/MocA family protein n=1 Tax=Halalkalibacterium halodurans TaxID=86665 RepID=UPI0010FE0F5A|nr:Gfo/Idh/MocA family oxidoreductase [Halalkalibacterium halodurans]MED4163581.1 Gfo/Idh/MocA family oxidoreductase [Halalkalibacterium halodurans]